MEKSIKSIATNYGLYLGILLTAIVVLGYALYLELFTQFWFSIMTFLVVIAFGVIAVAKSKSVMNGFLSFKQAFSSYFLTVLIGILISTAVSYIIFNFIDPAAAEVLKEKTIETSISMMEGFGAPAEAIAEAVDQMEQQNTFSIGNLLKGLAFQLVFYSIIGLIVAAVMKKSNPDA